ncbi:protein of unknown function [Caminicella sporogenes DSM 14501]|uniref:DUF948 domain-containing protein n=1 Tax=Caminicella sporogenes DSM 14501 TaxID=1121266 RepID=A0A1M6SEG2_9FIRM|nr:DUF948 domain-containing protein [Caminicella sporogenes]RKD26631.1 hypothetical protein BET04_10105 [Caminicella sporogenes]WIF95937.1 DUF948 domain-containing protein [Caminicella sporogenes]SHK43065.1 protein of unknown function [Caminicella sporogenes DSM 14501]
MSQITINLTDLGLIILWGALVTLIIYLILVLRKFYFTMKEIQEIISVNKENIEMTLNEMPSIAKNLDEITGEVSHDVQMVRGTIDAIAQKSEVAAASLEDTGDLITGIAAIIQVGLFIKNIYEKISPKKKRVI